LYFYQLKDNNDSPQNIPLVVTPRDYSTTGTPKRWILISVYEPDDYSLNLFANTLSQAASAIPLVINGVMSFDGDSVTFTNTLTSPFNVSSTEMVNNLNAEYINGYNVYDILPFAKIESIPDGVDEFNVEFAEPRLSSNYVIVATITNSIDADPSIYSCLITNKSATGFTAKFSDAIDSSYYKLNYMVINETVLNQAFLQDVIGDFITDSLGNEITVSF